MGQRRPANNKGRKKVAGAGKGRFKPRSFFKREAEWTSWMNVAPFAIGVLIALIFWFTR